MQVKRNYINTMQVVISVLIEVLQTEKLIMLTAAVMTVDLKIITEAIYGYKSGHYSFVLQHL